MGHMNTFFPLMKYNQSEYSISNLPIEISCSTIHSGIATIDNCKWHLFDSELKCTEEWFWYSTASLFFSVCLKTSTSKPQESKSENTQLWIHLDGHPVTSSMAWDSKSEKT